MDEFVHDEGLEEFIRALSGEDRNPRLDGAVAALNRDLAAIRDGEKPYDAPIDLGTT